MEIAIRKIVPKDQRIMSDKMSITEYTECKSIRKSAVDDGASLFLTKEEMDGIKTSEEYVDKEILLGKTPLIIRRTRGDGMIEEWPMHELTLPF
jgi:hypothetical protein